MTEATTTLTRAVKQYALFKKFEESLEAMRTPGIPDRLDTNRQAKAYYGAIRLELGETAVDAMSQVERERFTALALNIDTVVRNAIAENSLNPQSIEATIRQNLLPQLFEVMGLDSAKAVVEQVVQITRIGLSRE